MFKRLFKVLIIIAILIFLGGVIITPIVYLVDNINFRKYVTNEDIDKISKINMPLEAYNNDNTIIIFNNDKRINSKDLDDIMINKFKEDLINNFGHKFDLILDKVNNKYTGIILIKPKNSSEYTKLAPLNKSFIFEFDKDFIELIGEFLGIILASYIPLLIVQTLQYIFFGLFHPLALFREKS